MKPQHSLGLGLLQSKETKCQSFAARKGTKTKKHIKAAASG